MAEGRDAGDCEMKLVSWNVNGLRACMKKGFPAFFQASDADIFAVEETKMQKEQLDDSMRFAGYHMYMNSAEKKGYSGTLVYAKQEPLRVSYDLPGSDILEGRVITLEYPLFFFVCAYVPNAKEGLVRLKERTAWEDAMRAYLTALDQKKPVVYTGDLNVAHEEIDIKNPERNHENAGFSDAERAKMSELLDAGFTDTFRALYPEKVQYSWWSYRFKARERNAGWRIDYFLVSDRLRDCVKDAVIYDEVTGSDHCPVGLEIEFS